MPEKVGIIPTLVGICQISIFSAIVNITNFFLLQVFIKELIALFIKDFLKRFFNFFDMASNYTFRIPSLSEKQLGELDKNFNKLKSDLLSSGFDHSQMNNVVKLMNELLSMNKKSIQYLMEKTEINPEKIIHDVFGHCQNRLKSIDSQYKRYLRK